MTGIKQGMFGKIGGLGLVFGSGIAVLACSLVLAGPRGAVGDLYVADANNHRIVQIDGITGEVVGDFATAEMNNPFEARFGPNGHMFVVNWGSNSVTEYDGETGVFIRYFASEGMSEPSGLRFEPNGDMLIFNENLSGSSYLTEYDPRGGLIRTVAEDIGQGFSAPLDFGDDGNLYVSITDTNSVDRYSADGTFLGIFAQDDRLLHPECHRFGGDHGNLFIADAYSNVILEFDGTTGDLVGPFVDTHLDFPIGLEFGVDGNMWVVNSNSNAINEFDGVTGEWIREITGGFDVPIAITVKPARADCLSMVVSDLSAGRNAIWDVFGVDPGARVAVVYGFAAGSTTINGRGGFCASFGIDGVNANRFVGSAIADETGSASFVKIIPRNTQGLTILTQAAERGTCPDECVSNLVEQVVQ